jgi:hypothetical protein
MYVGEEDIVTVDDPSTLTSQTIPFRALLPLLAEPDGAIPTARPAADLWLRKASGELQPSSTAAHGDGPATASPATTAAAAAASAADGRGRAAGREEVQVWQDWRSGG